MIEPRTDTLVVPGARLHYKVRGAGPLLLLLPGGDGTADAVDGIGERLADGYTIVSHDRRGLSRSAVEDRTATPGIATHSEDARRLLAASTDEPALVFGTSIGALIGLDLVARHPQAIRRLVAFEPPASELLPAPERAAMVALQEEVEEIFRRDGVAAAMQRFVAMVGVDLEDREPDVVLPAPTPERIANLEFFLTHDAPAVRTYRLDMAGLRAARERVTLAAGRSARPAAGSEAAARALAAELGHELVEFTGGHTAPMLRPAEFADGLRAIFERVAGPPRPERRVI